MKKSISFVTPNFDRGGAQKNMLNIINSLDEKQFEIELVILLKNKNDYLKDLNKKIKIIEFKKDNNISCFFLLMNYFRKKKCDIVFSSLENTSLIITILKKICSLNYINIVRLPSLPSNNLYKTYSRFSLKYYKAIVLKVLFKILNRADCIICQTLEMKMELLNDFKFKNNNIHVITNIVDNNIILLAQESCKEIDKNNFNIISIGALYSIKGFDYLIKGFAEFTKKNPSNNAVLHILGDEQNEKGYRDYLLSLIIDLNLTGKVILHGHVENPYKFLVKCNLFILSSIKEGFPNVVLEALTLKVPVLATNCVNFEGIISQENGLIIQTQDSKQIMNGIETFYFYKTNNFNSIINNFNFNLFFNSLNENTSNNK